MPLRTVSSSIPSSVDQACAVPFRVDAERVEFCLITSSAGRWKFPKGFVEPGETFVEAALKEAFEEAGLHGRVIGDPIGCYSIKKKGRPRTVIAVLMEVSQCDAVWEEDAMRERRWATPEEAHALVSEPEVLELLQEAGMRLSAA